MALGSEKYILLTTFRRDGTPVSSPTWAATLDDGTTGFWTSSGSGKAKRLAHTARVTVQPCDARGRVKAGSAVSEGEAHLVAPPDPRFTEILSKIRAKYGFATKITHLIGIIGGIVKRKRIPYGDRGVVITITP